MTATRITFIRGDGITREVADPVLALLERAGAQLEIDEKPAGKSAMASHGTPLPDETIESIRANGVALKGKLFTPQGSGYASPNASLRRQLDLFANVRPIRNLPGLPARYSDLDIVVIRESTEDIYAGLEHPVSEGVVASLKVVTEAATERIARYAFEFARRHGRKKVTLVHKANIMKVTDGLLIRVVKRVHQESYTDLEHDTLIIDNASMQLLLRPSRYDVVLAGNLYGDIFSDLAAGIAGGISATYGAAKNEKMAIFESIHGDAPHLEGTGRANPLPLLMPACYMLEYIGQEDVAASIRNAIGAVLTAGEAVTPDLGGTANTQEMLDAIAAAL